MNQQQRQMLFYAGIIAAVVLAIGTVAGLWGWARRVRKPMDATRSSLKDNVRWAKEQMA